MLAKFLCFGFYLYCEFPRRREYKHLAVAACGVAHDALEDGDEERCCLAGTGLRLRVDIFAREGERENRCLYRHARYIARVHNASG